MKTHPVQGQPFKSGVAICLQHFRPDGACNALPSHTASVCHRHLEGGVAAWNEADAQCSVWLQLPGRERGGPLRAAARSVRGRTKTFCQPWCQGFCRVLPRPAAGGLRQNPLVPVLALRKTGCLRWFGAAEGILAAYITPPVSLKSHEAIGRCATWAEQVYMLSTRMPHVRTCSMQHTCTSAARHAAVWDAIYSHFGGFPGSCSSLPVKG